MNDVQCRAVFRKNLNRRIKTVGIKNVTLAKLAGVSASQAARWCEGGLMPTWSQFQRLLDIFGIESEQLLGTPISEHSYTARFK